MTLSKDELIDVVVKTRELGASFIKLGEFEARFDEKKEGPARALTPSAEEFLIGKPNPNISVVLPSVKDEKFEDILKPVSPFDDLTEDEVLYWGTAYGDELIAKRKAFEEELKNEKLK